MKKILFSSENCYAVTVTNGVTKYHLSSMYSGDVFLLGKKTYCGYKPPEMNKVHFKLFALFRTTCANLIIAFFLSKWFVWRS